MLRPNTRLPSLLVDINILSIYMSIATLARKIKTIKAQSIRSRWVTATTQSGKCAPCSGGAPLQQLSFRQLMKQNTKALYSAAPPPPQPVSASEYITSKILGQIGCDTTKTSPPCPSNGCGRCSCSSRIGESLCCNIHKECTTKTAGEYVNFYRLKRVCFPYLNV
jgi:hypothetical protein